MKSRRLSQKNLMAGAMGLVGLIVFIVAMPPQVVMMLSGVGLMAGAYLLMRTAS